MANCVVSRYPIIQIIQSWKILCLEENNFESLLFIPIFHKKYVLHTTGFLTPLSNMIHLIHCLLIYLFWCSESTFGGYGVPTADGQVRSTLQPNHIWTLQHNGTFLIRIKYRTDLSLLKSSEIEQLIGTKIRMAQYEKVIKINLNRRMEIKIK